LSQHEAAVLIGRDGERDALEGFLGAVREGSRTMLIEGQPGIGKTALWKWAVGAATERGYRVLCSRPVEAEVTLPFTALGDLLDGVEDDAMERLPEPQRVALDAVQLRVTEGAGLQQRAISLGLLGVLRSLAAAGPLVVAVDDLQWLDPSSAAVLQFAVRRLDVEPVAVVATQRSGWDASVRGRLDRAVDPDRLRRLSIGPLDGDSLERLIRRRLGAGLSRAVTGKLHRACGGNPFFALEIATVLVRRGLPRRPDEPFPVPENLRELVRDRLARLPPAAGEIALVVSALAQPTLALVEASEGGNRDRALLGVSDAVAAGVIEVEGERLRFTHPLLGSVLYSDTPLAARRALHRRLADLVSLSEERARHLALAAEGPDPEAAAALDDAARQAYARGAPDAAAELCETAVALTPPDRLDERGRRAIAAAEHHFQAGDAERAEAILRELLAGLRSGSLRGRALERLARLRWYAGGWEECGALWRDALAEAGDDLDVREASEEGLGLARWVGGDLRAGARHLQTASVLARRLGDAVRMAETLAEQAFFEWFLGAGTEASTMERALAHEDWSIPVRILRRPTYFGARLLVWQHDLAAARPKVEFLLQQAAASGDQSALPYVLAMAGELDFLAGDWERAGRRIGEAREAAEQSGERQALLLTLADEARIDAHLGREDVARATVEHALGLARGVDGPGGESDHLAVLGFLELSLGRAAGADRHLWPLAAHMAAAGIEEPCWSRFVPDEIEALVALGDAERAASLLRPFAERSRALERTWGLATAARCRGLLRAAEGDSVAALSALEEALQHHAKLAEPFELARTLLVLGAVRRRAGMRRAARQALENALAICDELAAVLWSQRVRDELGRISGRAPGRLALTPTERRVAELVAEGRTNREVAATLYLSPRTVESNLTRIYRKLDVRSRTELAHRMLAGPSPD
jgi:DNA-binding CsgD family transcriptional regulator